MNIDLKKIRLGLGILLAIIGVVTAFLYFLNSKGHSATQTTPTGPLFGTSGNAPQGSLVNPAETLPVFTSTSSPNISNVVRVFSITKGPVVNALLLQNGSSTIARYVTGGDGHILEIAVNTPGATATIVSNTTIPGIVKAVWTEKGQGVIVQYLESQTLKSAHILLPPAGAAAATSSASIVRFLPDNILFIAPSPDGKSIAYSIPSASGIDTYTSKPDGSNAKKLFSLPLSQTTLSWPSTTTIVVASKSASGIEGLALMVNAKTGAVSPLLYGSGLTALGNTTFSHVLYRTDDSLGSSIFALQLSNGVSTFLLMPYPLGTPLPEQCIWSTASTTTSYCAVPVSATPSGYLDFWHRGQLSLATALVAIDAGKNNITPLATPGTKDGGVPSDMVELSLSPDESYLSFIAKDDQSLWGVVLRRN